jgi:ABC-2 type transport system ATP-binding protein
LEFATHGTKVGEQVAIIVDSLVKVYSEKPALDHVSFEVKRGEVFGFLGPNGAGKTTAIKILTTLLRPTDGRATVLGHDVATDGAAIRKRIGVVQQDESYELNLSVERALDLYGLMWDVPRRRRRTLVQELLPQFGLEDIRRQKMDDLSIGQRRRVQVAREFMHDMDLLFLDEPTQGLDPLARRTALDFFRQRARNGLTIFFTTHMLEEAEYLCDRIGLINRGRLIAVDTPQNIKRQFGKSKTVEVKLQEAPPPEFWARLKTLAGVEQLLAREESSVALLAARPEEIIPQVLRIIEQEKLRLASIYVAEPSLEDVFITMMQEPSV